MTTEITIRFKNYNNDVYNRVTGSILLATEAKTAKPLIGGFYFDTQRHPMEVLADFEADGFELGDFENFEFEVK